MAGETDATRRKHVVVGKTAAGQVFANLKISGDQVRVMNSGVFDRAVKRAGRNLKATATLKTK